MLMQGDFDLNSVQIYTESLKEVLKKNMLHQEVIFRKQVQELHRIYGMQKTLMGSLAWKEFHKYNLMKENTQSPLLPCTNPARHEQVAKETTFSSISMVGLTQSTSHILSEGHQGIFYKFQQRPLDLQLPADQYISHVDPELKFSLSIGEDCWRKGGTKRTWFDKESHSCTHNVIDLEEESTVRISNEDEKHAPSFSYPTTNFGGEHGSQVSVRSVPFISSTKRTWFNKESHSCTHNVIDLEDSNEDEKHAPSLSYASPTTNFGGEHESQVSVRSVPFISSSVKKDESNGIADSFSLLGDSHCKERNFSNKGFEKCHGGLPHSNLSTKMQQLTSYKAADVDLNKVQLDHSSCYSNDTMMAHPSIASSSHFFTELAGRIQEDTCPSTALIKAKNKCSNEASDMLQQVDDGNSVLIDSNNKRKRTEIRARNSQLDGMSGSEVALLGVEAVSRPPLGLCEDFVSHSSDSKNGNVGCISELPSSLLHDRDLTYVATRHVNSEKSEVEDIVFSCSDQSQNTVQDGHGNISPASCKSHCVAENDSSSIKTMQSGTERGSSNLSTFDRFSGSHVGSQVAETLSGDQDQGSSGISDLKLECLNKKAESSEVDVLIHRAAESLVHISLERSAGKQDSSAKRLTEMNNEEREQPQYSSDSFELITLNLKECDADDYCVSSTPFEVNDTEPKDFSLKLRRGRRLKDFQRDILPGLSSLSRHEIREDINILEGVLRSREYRKMRAKMGDRQSWCIPTRSRRSRLNNVGRRRF